MYIYRFVIKPSLYEKIIISMGHKSKRLAQTPQSHGSHTVVEGRPVSIDPVVHACILGLVCVMQ